MSCKCSDNAQKALNILAHIHQEAHDGDLSGDRIRRVVDENRISLPSIHRPIWTLVLDTEAKHEAEQIGRDAFRKCQDALVAELAAMTKGGGSVTDAIHPLIEQLACIEAGRVAVQSLKN